MTGAVRPTARTRPCRRRPTSRIRRTSSSLPRRCPQAMDLGRASVGETVSGGGYFNNKAARRRFVANCYGDVSVTPAFCCARQSSLCIVAVASFLLSPMNFSLIPAELRRIAEKVESGTRLTEGGCAAVICLPGSECPRNPGQRGPRAEERQRAPPTFSIATSTTRTSACSPASSALSPRGNGMRTPSS